MQVLQSEEQQDEESTCNNLEHFSDYAKVIEMIQTLKSTDEVGFEKDYQNFAEILSKYQEQPHLLDPHLEELLKRLLAIVRDVKTAQCKMHAGFKYLYILSKVRTYKVLVKFLPHELSDLEFVLELLEQQNAKQTENWETRYVLLLWLSILVLNPFHMSRLDAYDTNDDSVAPQKSKMQRIFELCQLYASTNDTCSQIAAYLAAKYLVRSDVKDVYLSPYFDWVMAQNTAETLDARFGQLAAVAAILKHGKREDLLPYADKLLQWIIACHYQDNTNFLKYKYATKIVQRIGLVYIKPRVASWRYQRGTRSLAVNMANVDAAAQNQQNADTTAAMHEAPEESLEQITVPDEIEDVIEQLLHGLRSSSNEVRWSAAKGIGRVTNRLSKELADEVIGSVLEVLSPIEPHDAWHGACVALAELAKRGLLLPHRLEEIVPVLMQALFYDEMKGCMSVGQTIRDAACYMCWAFARAYNPADLQPFVQQISAGLLTVAIFDREINCRRAASAAFQESVGRLGNFPHGIEISTAVDFYSVGLRQHCYLQLSDLIAQHESYRVPLIEHLLQRKVNHWDVAIRELTAKALNKLTARAPLYMVESVLPALLLKIDATIDINMRHGVILALGEITLALREIEQAQNRQLLSQQLIDSLNELLPKLLQRDLFRGMSGELLKLCCTDFIRNLSQAKLSVSNECLAAWQQILNKCLLNKTMQTRESAAKAFTQVCLSYYQTPDRHDSNTALIRSYIAGANKEVEQPTRMGYLNALGALPRFLYVANFDEVLDCLLQHALVPAKYRHAGNAMELPKENELTRTTQVWSEARREGVKALQRMIETVGFDSADAVSFGNAHNFNKVLDTLLDAMHEYTLDNRGDIGAWVREAAMLAIYQLLTTCPKHLLQPAQVHNIIVGLMQQSVEKIDRTRGLAGRLVCNLINLQPALPYIKLHEQLKTIFPTDANAVLWLFADHTFPLFCSLLQYAEYSKRVLLGLSASIGQLTESLIKHSSSALFTFLRSHPAEVPRLCREIILNFEENLLNERVTYPMLNFLDLLIGSGTINSVLLDDNNTFVDDVYRLVNIEVKGHKKLYKTISSINVYCQLVQVPRIYKKVLSKLAIFLGLPHVHVRRTTATKLYESLILHGDACDINEQNMEEISALLIETDWGLPLLEVRPIRNKLCELFDIKAPVSNAAANAN